jgi:polysaccharide export outer membrane protein
MGKGATVKIKCVASKVFSVAFAALLLSGTLTRAYAEDYKIAPSDVLEVSVYGDETVTRGQLIVRPDGKISYPLVGDVTVAGLSTSEAKDAIEERMKEYIPGAMVTVIVQQLGSLQYYVIGKVAKPGMYNISNEITVLQALALAGGPTTFADESGIAIVRKSGPEDIRLPFNYSRVKKGKDLEQNILLQRGDVIIVP